MFGHILTKSCKISYTDFPGQIFRFRFYKIYSQFNKCTAFYKEREIIGFEYHFRVKKIKFIVLRLSDNSYTLM